VILADTSVWIDHLHKPDRSLVASLPKRRVLIHSMVIGEIACGQLRDRGPFLERLNALPRAIEARHDEVMQLLEQHRLMGRGLGWIDLHLLCSAMLSEVKLHTRDKRLRAAAEGLGVSVDGI